MPVATYAAMKSGLKVHLRVGRGCGDGVVATYAAMKSGLKETYQKSSQNLG